MALQRPLCLGRLALTLRRDRAEARGVNGWRHDTQLFCDTAIVGSRDSCLLGKHPFDQSSKRKSYPSPFLAPRVALVACKEQNERLVLNECGKVFLHPCITDAHLRRRPSRITPYWCGLTLRSGLHSRNDDKQHRDIPLLSTSLLPGHTSPPSRQTSRIKCPSALCILLQPPERAKNENSNLDNNERLLSRSAPPPVHK